MGSFFLEVNGLDSLVNKFISEMENIAVIVADNIIDKDLLLEVVTSLINEEDYNESLKLKIIYCLQQVNPEADKIIMGPEFYKEL